MTSNDIFGRLNQRFEARAAVLRKMGFTYETCEAYNSAFFCLRRTGRKAHFVAAAAVLNAEPEVWASLYLADASRAVESIF